MKYLHIIIFIFISNIAKADIYDEFTDSILSKTRTNAISNYTDDPKPNHIEVDDWARMNNEISIYINSAMSKNGVLFNIVASKFKDSFNPEEISILMKKKYVEEHDQVFRRYRSVAAAIKRDIIHFVTGDMRNAIARIRKS